MIILANEMTTIPKRTFASSNNQGNKKSTSPQITQEIKHLNIRIQLCEHNVGTCVTNSNANFKF